MIVLNSLLFFFTQYSYVTAIFLLMFVFGLLFRLLRW